MALFDIPVRTSRSRDMNIAKKSNATSYNPAPITIKGGGGIINRIAEIKAITEKNLGKYRDEYQVIRDKEVIHDFITECIGNQYISIDTETSGLDPMRDTLAGIGTYTYGQKSAYIPLNHISYITNEKVDNQLPVEFVRYEFKRLFAKKPDVDMFNAPFDIRFLRNQAGIDTAYCTWDSSIGSRLLNENEPAKNLKALYNKYCCNGEEDVFRFDDLFKGIPFTLIPIDIGYLYSAHDPYITSRYCDYQRPFLTMNNPSCIEHNLQQVAWVFHNIEMPIVDVVCDMEDTGVLFDFKYNEELKSKYHNLLEEKSAEFTVACNNLKDKIDSYRQKTPNCKLSNPINIDSPSQLSILFYDIMKVPVVDVKSPRGTGVNILKQMNNSVAKIVLEYRAISKLVSTYIDKLPECVNPDDGRIHCKFNQYGADTGRFSSSDPNLQNIPSHNKDIRKMFIAGDSNVLLSSDFSQQEPKCLAALCRQHGDSKMYDTFMAGKDLYSEIASKSFNVPYEDCLEFRKDGTTNKEGKERRTQAKSILLGVLYGRGVPSIAEQLGCEVEKAQQIKDSVFRAFPAIKKFEDDSLNMAYTKGYVTTVCGRKRRLPDMQLPNYEFSMMNNGSNDLFDFEEQESQEVPNDRVQYYLSRLSKVRWGEDKQKVFKQANAEGIWIVDNGKKIADATRQCVNARIQGSAADLTKLAMIDIHNNEHLKELGFKMLIPVHDEIIAQCPEKNAKECARLLAEIMSKSAEKILEMPIKCDVTVTHEWYGEEIEL